MKYMKRSTFLLLAAIGSFGFGALMFFAPAMGSDLLGLDPATGTLSVLRGLGGLIIGSGAINILACRSVDTATLRIVLLANIITHGFGLLADAWGIADGALTIVKMAPVESTHLFVGIGSLITLMRLPKGSR